MPVPVVAASSSGGNTTLSGGAALTMPSNIAAGDLLLVMAVNDNPGTTNMTLGGDWTLIEEAAYTGDVIRARVWAKIAAGGDTATLNGAAQDYAYVIARITGHAVTAVATDIVSPAAASGSSATPDPPTTGALPATADWMFVEFAASDDDDDTATFWSTGYTSIAQVQSASSTSSCLASVAYKTATNTSAAEDPGTMALALTEEWLAFTLAFKGSPQRAWWRAIRSKGSLMDLHYY